MKILLLNPNKWGRGITHLWIASHSGLIKAYGSEVELFDCTFFSDWSENETSFNTRNGQYQPTDYENQIKFKANLIEHLQERVDSFSPDIILTSAVSSHIHGEGEYINIELANLLLGEVNTMHAFTIAGGIQATDDPTRCKELFVNINYFISGDCEPVIEKILAASGSIKEKLSSCTIPGSSTLEAPLKRFSLAQIPPYDYSIFPDQTFLRPFNGSVVRAIDYEISRGCPYSCAYCVETVIQRYYGFTSNNKLGVIDNFNSYLTLKSIEQVESEITSIVELDIQLVRCQDTNFLSIPHELLKKISHFIQKNTPSIQLYIETRPETITQASIRLLKELNVVGVGMGVETAADSYKEDSLNRYASINKTIRAFKLLKEAGIMRSAYNILGLPGQNVNDITATIELNRILRPDNITASFYSPFRGTRAYSLTDEYSAESYRSDSQLRTNTCSTTLDSNTLQYYKENFARLVRK